MKVIPLYVLFFFCFASANGQVSSVSENFDVPCAVSTGFPTSWRYYNPLPGTYSNGSWHCTPTNGRVNGAGVPTPGITCTGVWSGTYHLDTSYLISPSLLMSSAYPDRVYLRFDSKTDKVHLSGKSMEVIMAPANDSFFRTIEDTVITGGLFPEFGPGDSSDWVTHEVDITAFKGGAYYIGFRYVSTVADGSIWYLDNINTSGTKLGVKNVKTGALPITVIGNSTADKITLSFTGVAGSAYRLSIFDMLGREVYKESVTGQAGTMIHVINNADLRPGMYVVKLGDELSFGSVKVVVQ